MKRIHTIILILFLLACNSENQWDCIQSTGEPVSEVYEIEEPIQVIHIFDDINLAIGSSSSQHLQVNTGANLLPEIQITEADGILSIRNENSCRWSRSPYNVEVIFFTDTLIHIEKLGYGNIRSVDVLENSVRIFSYVPGEISLDVDNYLVGLDLFALTNVTLNGESDVLSVYMNRGKDGIVRAENLEVMNATIVHDGYNDIHVRPLRKLNYYLWNAGNILLYNEPDSLNEVERKGTGELILIP
jgi:hypothetical protein